MKLKNILFILLVFFLNTSTINAATANINVYTDRYTVIVGNYVNVTVTVSSNTPLANWKFNLKYDTSILTLVSGDTYVIDYVMNETTKSKTYTYKFKAKASGSSKIYVNSSEVNSWSDDNPAMQVNNYYTTVTSMTQSQLEATYSKDNYLKSLKVEGHELDKTFNKDTLEYNLEVENEVSEINVNASVNDSKSKLNGTGKKTLNEGANTIKITVIAQNGNERVYKINVTRKELNPIIVKLDGIDYNVIRKSEELKNPANIYTLSKITINEEEVPCYYNEELKYNIVGLKDNQGNLKYFLYENNTYIPYEQIIFNNVIFRPLNKEIILENYKKNSIVIENITLDSYKINDTSRYSLIYGINLETNNEGIYMYDNIENTIQSYNDEEITILNDKIDYLTKQNYVFVITTILFVYLLLLSLIYIIVKERK